MYWKRKFGLGIALMLGGGLSVQAQFIDQITSKSSAGPITGQWVASQNSIPSSPVTSIPAQAGNSAVGYSPVTVITPVPTSAISAQGIAPTSAQLIPTMPAYTSRPIMLTQGTAPGAAPTGLETGSKAEALSTTDVPVGDEKAPALGPTPVEDVKLLMNTGPGDFLKDLGIRTFGWMSMGYTYATSGPGQHAVEPLENRFGNEFTVNQLALVLERPLKTDELSFGFRAEPFIGADAALLNPKGGIVTSPSSRMGFDFRQLYASAHLPILTDGGVDIKAGRQYTVIGYESAMAPYRPFYSNSYQWYYSEDGANTSLSANWHVSKQLSLYSAITQGANTFFTNRTSSPSYIGQVNYWLQEEKKTLLVATVMAGNQAVISGAPFVAGPLSASGDFAKVLELRMHHEWNRCLTQIVQANMGWDQEVPGIGSDSWYSLYNMTIYHASKTLDLNSRLEWFDDVHGSRTGFATNYEAVTIGCDYHPYPWLRLRPELRGDFADAPAFRGSNSQMTAAVECLLQF